MLLIFNILFPKMLFFNYLLEITIKLNNMKKLILFLTLLFVLQLSSQESYWTSYNFIVEPHNEAAVVKLTNDYFSEHKQEGVTVSLWENHFNDSENNFTHSIVFSGSLDALGKQYSSGPSDTWSLFITRINQHIEKGFSSAMGNGISVYGEENEEYPVRRLFSFRVSDPAAYAASFNEFNSKHNPKGRLIILGQINSGHSPEGETHFVVTGFKNFKAAMGGVTKLVPDENKKAFQKAWQESREEGGDVKLIRSSTRVRLGSW